MDKELLPPISSPKRPRLTLKSAQGPEESFKYLCFYVATPTDGTLREYTLMFVPLLDLFGKNEHEAHVLLQKVKSWYDELAGFSFLRTKDDTLFVVGGYTETEPVSTLMLKYAMSIEYNPDRGRYELDLKEEKRPRVMPSRMLQMDPIVEEIGSSIYVLSKFFHTVYSKEDMEAVMFQAYNPADDEWTVLPSPPFVSDLNRYPSYCHSHVVVGDKLCISTPNYSCAFDTKTKKWAPCELFNANRVIFDEYGEVKFFLGSPFRFVGNGLVIHQKFLVCIEWMELWSVLAAYKIEDNGKLSSRQILFEDTSEYWMRGGGLFVDLGDDYFCVLGMVPENPQCEATMELKFMKCKVSMTADKEHLVLDKNDVKISTVTSEGQLWCGSITSFFAC